MLDLVLHCTLPFFAVCKPNRLTERHCSRNLICLHAANHGVKDMLSPGGALLSRVATELCGSVASQGSRNSQRTSIERLRLLQKLPVSVLCRAGSMAAERDPLSLGLCASSRSNDVSGGGGDSIALEHRDRTLTALDIPPSDRLGPLVEHLAVPRDGPVTDIISEVLGLPHEFATRLISFGAVHYCPISPLPPAKIARRDAAGKQQLERAHSMRALGAARHGKDPRLSIPRRLAENVDVHQHGYLRVHLHPRRFPAAHSVNWKDRVVVEGEDWLVLNKPPGVQVAPTICNVRECCLTLAAQAIGRSEPLLITHRLDGCTEGLLVLGKTKAFVQRFNPLLATAGGLRKTYRALSHTPLQPGPLVHFVSIRQRQPGHAAHTVVHEGEPQGSLRCELEVLSAQRVQLTGEARRRWGATAFEHLIELKTGRTHQIRVQFAAAGSALLGDHMYGDSEQAPADVLVHDVPADAVQGRRAVMEPIGLQAYKLDICDDGGLMGRSSAVFCAAEPWWRS